MKILKLFLILTLMITIIEAKTTDSLVLRGYVPYSLQLSSDVFESKNIKSALHFNGDKRKFKVKKLKKTSREVFIEVTFH